MVWGLGFRAYFFSIVASSSTGRGTSWLLVENERLDVHSDPYIIGILEFLHSLFTASNQKEGKGEEEGQTLCSQQFFIGTPCINFAKVSSPDV